MASPLLIVVTILAIATPSLATTFPVNTSAIKDTLHLDFYKRKCPNVEKIVLDVMKRSTEKKPGWIPGILRLHFHDCFISGCDGSILLTPERYNSYASEYAHPLNSISLRGMEAIHEMKAELEKQCPGIVSCADILAYAARDAIVLAGNPHYKIPAGRRDSGFVDGNLAIDLPGSFPVDRLVKMYAAKGLTVDDLVVLEGGHSIGQTRCKFSIADDSILESATGASDILDKKFRAAAVSKYCPEPNTEWLKKYIPLNTQKLDSDWGVSFFNNLLKGKGSVPADLAMAVNSTTKGLVKKYANNPAIWAKKFNRAMIKLGKMNVLTGEQGEIRRHCSYMNAANM